MDSFLISDRHSLYSFIETFDHLSAANFELEWGASFGFIKRFAIFESVRDNVPLSCLLFLLVAL